MTVGLIMAAVGAGVAMILASVGAIPTMATGGYVTKGGVAMLHPAEVVVPAGEAGRIVNYNTFHIEGTVREEADIAKIAEAVAKKQNSEYGSRTY
jgi:hypothetical protein